MDKIIIFSVIAIVILIFVCINAVRKKKASAKRQPLPTSSEKELPAKFTKKQFSKIEEKVDVLTKKNSELEKLVKELKSQIEVLRKDIKTLQVLNTKVSPNPSENSSRTADNTKNKKKTPVGKEQFVTMSFEHLTIGGNGNLIHCEEGYPIYYKAWREREIIKFEFVNSDRTKKAINNRSTYIEPFCNKIEESKFPDESDHIETITPGILNDDYTVKEKAIINYK